jgi:hypothetical protein
VPIRLTIQSDARMDPPVQVLPLRGAARGTSTTFAPEAPHLGARGVAFSGTGNLLGDRTARLHGSLIYDDPNPDPDPETAPFRASGNATLTLDFGTVSLLLTSTAPKSDNPSLLFPTTFAYRILGGTGAYQNGTGAGIASLVFNSGPRRGPQPTKQTFQIIFGD